MAVTINVMCKHSQNIARQCMSRIGNRMGVRSLSLAIFRISLRQLSSAAAIPERPPGSSARFW
ncbi:hypothetical protein LJR234_006362 [Mesorhizobium amorphae]|uniref:hypothetical protein n=1 Tax=Mesorhizobium TaxID=68287 RepID=UPI001553B82C|nr:hypothetical protein [Mesorhizobium sp. NZP2298]